LVLKIIEEMVFDEDTDTDGDGINDIDEGTADDDGDGIPNYLDSVTLGANVLEESVEDTKNHYLVESEPGTILVLGKSRLDGEAGGILIDENELLSVIGEENNDQEYQNSGGVFDFIIRGLPEAGQSISIVIPLRQVIPADAVYRKYDTTSQTWYSFVEDEFNIIRSTSGEPGYCPSPGSIEWEPGLSVGYWCVELTIEDGGPNDADAEVNNEVVDPGGIGILPSSNLSPIATDDLDMSVVINTATLLDILSNDTDPDDDSLEIIFASAALGDVSIEGNQLLYTPAVNFAGFDVATYSVSDGNGGVDTADIFIEVILNQAPVAGIDSANVTQGNSVTLNVLANDTDEDGDELTVISATASNGTVSIGNDGNITYTPNANFYGDDVVIYTIEDAAGNQATGTVNVNVEQYVNVVTVTQSKDGGGGGSFEMVTLMLLLMLLIQRQTQILNLKQTGKRLGLLASLLLLSMNIQAAGSEGWYIGGQLGTAKTDVSTGELDSLLSQQGIDGEITSLDSSDSSYHFFAGYTFDSNLSLQLDFIDWGDRELQITGGTNIGDLDSYYAAVANIYPETGDAVKLSAAYAWPLTDAFSVSAKLGLLSWDSDYQTIADNDSVGNSTADGFELSIGAELQYHLNRDATIFLAVDTVNLENHRMNSFGIGVRYYLGDVFSGNQ